MQRASPATESHADACDADWSGFSEEEEMSALVVDYQSHEKPSANVSKEDAKLFMSTKPPIQTTKDLSNTRRTKAEPSDPGETATDAANLKKDLALQRLLEESHLLDPASSLAPSGQKRHKALDIRQQALGSKSSMFSQKKMPLAQRKGILAKATERDEQRRREARENGIILEKTIRPIKQKPPRQREIGAPTVGKFARGLLTLSKKDISDIVGEPRKSKRR
ncbi:MAG: hypothetical protein Q9219_002328 [cf. Caloplaca sp. 3 TL-2023]